MSETDIVRPLCIAVMATGGQGGGVLTNWLVQLAESNGWRAQATSVPGVAQRTGATVYYVEMVPDDGREPVLALMPSPGEVDLVVCAELMEAGRAIQRGFVAPERTTLISSTHRAFAVAEKIVPGDGVADSTIVDDAGSEMAKRFIRADMAKIALDNGSVISAALFGAIAASSELPFKKQQFHETIKASGVGVDASIATFDAAYAEIQNPTPVSPVKKVSPRTYRLTGGTAADREAYTDCVKRINDEFPETAHTMLAAGLQAVVDYQDLEYGREYLDRVAALTHLDRDHGGEGQGFALTIAAAKFVARAMMYDDVIRVADLKTRDTRFQRVRDDLRVQPDAVVKMTEFMHPRLEEICGTLPRGLGHAIEASGPLDRMIRKFTDKGRRVRTDSIRWFVVLYLVAGLRRWRRSSLRHSREAVHMQTWLDAVQTALESDYALAVEVLECRRLIKGYSDTHERGLSKYDRVLGALDSLKHRPDGADWLRRLRQAALDDEPGDALEAVFGEFASVQN